MLLQIQRLAWLYMCMTPQAKEGEYRYCWHWKASLALHKWPRKITRSHTCASLHHCARGKETWWVHQAVLHLPFSQPQGLGSPKRGAKQRGHKAAATQTATQASTSFELSILTFACLLLSSHTNIFLALPYFQFPVVLPKAPSQLWCQILLFWHICYSQPTMNVL